MKLRTMAIATIFLALILTASPLGYCYSNIMASKTTDDVSDYQSTTRICLPPGGMAPITITVILGEGVVTSGVTCYVLSEYMLSAAETSAIAAMGSFVPYQVEIIGNGATIVLTGEAAAIASGLSVGSISAPYAVPIAVIGLGITALVILVTATGAYFWWSST